ncbi:hypothetical protein A3J41_00175 [candidate division TM6 bacterium RIFCSPHIGHO2_12_FULL_38_8]|nr:MAG: hypothetical protein A3J41_00175 [candidate division TM6 bacterium RIFCSPHIGHO2_12_FULL_38_8]
MLPLDRIGLKQLIRRICAAKQTIFLENIFDAIADKMTRYIVSVHASDKRPRNRKQMKIQEVEIKLDVIDAISKVYIGLANILNTLLFISMQNNEQMDNSLRPFVIFFKNGGTFDQICDCICQAIVEIPDAELSQLIYQIENKNETATVFTRFNTRLALNLRRKVEVAAFLAEQKIVQF